MKTLADSNLPALGRLADAFEADKDVCVDSSYEILREIEHRKQHRPAPMVVALDGGSGAGKSTLAARLERCIDAVIVPLDDFFAADTPDWEWETRSIAERARDVFDWQRLRVDALEPLRAGRRARWYPFDFAAGLDHQGTYRLSKQPVERHPASVIILDGAYSASPEIADLVDFAVLVDVPTHIRHKRLSERENEEFLQRWHAIWDEVERYYFTEVRPGSSFDLVISGH